jgi:hypothetical protein
VDDERVDGTEFVEAAGGKLRHDPGGFTSSLSQPSTRSIAHDLSRLWLVG